MVVIACAQKPARKLNIVNRSLPPQNQLSTAQMYGAGMKTGCPTQITEKNITKCLCNPGYTLRKVPDRTCGTCLNFFPHPQIVTGVYQYFAYRN